MLAKFQIETALYTRFAALLREAGECAEAFQQAGMLVPEPLQRMLSERESDIEAEYSRETTSPLVPPIKREDAPAEAEEDWVSVSVHECSPTSVTLALLRSESDPIRPRDLIERVLEILPSATAGSIANIGTRLGGTAISREEDGWSLMNPEAAPVLLDGYLWGPPSAFTKQEIAAHRREAILHVLAEFPSGLQVVQIVEQLKRLDWVKAPINKDLLKEDVNQLSAEHKIRRRGNSAKWELRPEVSSLR